ncbi:MAG: TonB-dependent receptor, partial [Pseudohongiellaceae bacterium]
EGRVTAANGNPIADGRVTIPGTGYATSSGSNGEYRLEVPAGTYELRISRGGYAVETVPGVVVTNAQTIMRNVSLEAEMEQLVVMGRAMLEGTAASVIGMQREAMTVTEISGSEEFARMGDSTAADTLQRLTGLTVEDNKFVVIRGQPKRYTSTLFNGSQLPSIDPIQQITPLDLFPSGVLSNIAVQKAFTADKPGSFGSGMVELNTSGMPREDFIEFKGSSSVNQYIKEDGLEFNTGNDRFGNINDILKLPPAIAEVQEAGTPIATLPADERLALARSFSEELAPGYLKNMGPDLGVSISGGKRLDTDYGSYGASLTFDYGQNARYEEEHRLLLTRASDDTPQIQDDYTVQRSKLNTNLGGLLALTAEWYDHRVKSNTFWIRDVTEKVEMDEGVFQPSDTQFLRRFLLEYEHRELLMQQFSGRHDFQAVQFDWRLLWSSANRELPDRRQYQLDNTDTTDGSGQWFLDSRPPNLLRSFSSVEEDTFSGGVDMTLPVFVRGNIVADIKTGFDYDYRDRLSTQRQFGFNTIGNRFRPVEQIFARENIGDDVTFTEFGGTANDYNSEVEILGGYAQLDLSLVEKFRIVAGARLEDASFDIQTFVGIGGEGSTPINSGFEQQKVLPSLVASWSLFENTQIRAGLTRSLSYPSTVEVSDTSFVDTEANESFVGNPDLEPTIIDSADLRWEWYPGRDEMLTIGAFYKDFTDPIERSFLPASGTSTSIVTFDNADKGNTYGIELNSYFNFSRFIRSGPDWINNMHFGINFAWQESEVETVEQTVATNQIRRMTGQPDTLFNLQLGYTGMEHVVRLKFGRVGERLITAGAQGLPDEFLEAHLDLGMKWSYTPITPLTVSLELNNLLNDAFQRTQGEFTIRDYKTGVTGKLGLSWRFDLF